MDKKLFERCRLLASRLSSAQSLIGEVRSCLERYPRNLYLHSLIGSSVNFDHPNREMLGEQLQRYRAAYSESLPEYDLAFLGSEIRDLESDLAFAQKFDELPSGTLEIPSELLVLLGKIENFSSS